MDLLQVITHPYKTHQSFSIIVQVGYLLHSSQTPELFTILHRVIHNHIISNRLPVLQERSDGNTHPQLVISSSGSNNRIFMLLQLANRDTRHPPIQLAVR